jgi:hypothetical protein
MQNIPTSHMNMVGAWCIFIAIDDERDEEDSCSHQEEWQGFVEWFRQSQDSIPFADRRFAVQDALYPSHVQCKTVMPYKCGS